VRIISDVLEGAAKPVGGDAEGTIRVTSPESPVPGVGPDPKPRRATSRKRSASTRKALAK